MNLFLEDHEMQLLIKEQTINNSYKVSSRSLTSRRTPHSSYDFRIWSSDQTLLFSDSSVPDTSPICSRDFRGFVEQQKHFCFVPQLTEINVFFLPILHVSKEITVVYVAETPFRCHQCITIISMRMITNSIF